MGITLNHTIVPARDKYASARFLAHLFGLEVEEMGHFAAVRINDALTLDYDDRENFESHHYAFQVGNEDFDAIFTRLKGAGLSYAADPFHRNIGQINTRKGGRGFYFLDPNGHNFEVLTRA
ncbi:MAG: VOC family protein [Candidatus Binataceae bacterium]